MGKLSSTIQPSYGTQTYSTPTKARETKQAGTRGSSFMDMAAQASRSRADTFTTNLGGLAGMAAMPTSLMMDLAVRSGGQVQAAAAAAQRRAMWERTAAAEALEKSFSNIGDLLKTRMVSAPAITPEISLPAGANMFFLNMV